MHVQATLIQVDKIINTQQIYANLLHNSLRQKFWAVRIIKKKKQDRFFENNFLKVFYV